MTTERSFADDEVDDERRLIDALRRGDEAAFVTLIERYHTRLVRLAQAYVPSHAIAEEVAQETWLGVLRGIGQFEGRSSLKTWLYSILTKRARTRGQREGRSVPFADLSRADAEGDESAVDPDQFLPPGHEYAGWWSRQPQSWDAVPESRLLAQETRAKIDDAISALPPSQRTVITLRDIEGWASAEVCEALGITEANQRVLLHRARSKVRGALASYLSEGQL
ncbi:sigma-70 family RNA polymerase sigma factor [Chloroflexales bacterium ZM16-3]|nr:sigma-70 family RNA polymerase sigma factor [Chloroflexales bacterium ZM16-3]